MLNSTGEIGQRIGKFLDISESSLIELAQRHCFQFGLDATAQILEGIFIEWFLLRLLELVPRANAVENAQNEMIARTESLCQIVKHFGSVHHAVVELDELLEVTRYRFQMEAETFDEYNAPFGHLDARVQVQKRIEFFFLLSDMRRQLPLNG